MVGILWWRLDHTDMPEKSDIYKIVKLIMTRNLNPVIIFAFSKRECESLAMQMSKLDFNSEDEASQVQMVFENAIGGLSEDDRKLPQIELILPLLKRGIGIHHGGLLPILKEVIELLFQEGLIKALFATETFSIGLNMPAKTVVFTSVRKFDGKDFRNLSGGVSVTCPVFLPALLTNRNTFRCPVVPVDVVLTPVVSSS